MRLLRRLAAAVVGPAVLVSVASRAAPTQTLPSATIHVGNVQCGTGVIVTGMAILALLAHDHRSRARCHRRSSGRRFRRLLWLLSIELLRLCALLHRAYYGVAPYYYGYRYHHPYWPNRHW
jgi:hypothetical protein